MRTNILTGFLNTNYFLMAIGLLCASALGFAYGAEYFLHMESCPICVYQRYVYGITLFAAFDGLLLAKKKGRRILFSAALFFLNFGIASYQVGLQKSSIVLEQCWNVLGLSMAGYNALFAFLCGVLCLIFCTVFLQDRNNERKV